MATLTTYTQALQHIDTQDILDYEYTHLPATKHLNPFSELFLRVEVAEWQFKADDATHVYRIQYPEGNDLFGTLVYAEYMRDVEPATVAVSLRLLPDTAAEIIKAVLAERVAHQTQPNWTGRTLAETFGPGVFKPASDWRAWREGEGNNP